jgi:hypothetical protein
MMYVATTPFMPADNKGDPVVHELNARALAVVTARGIPFIDLYTRVTDKCGDLYTNCSICAVSRLPAPRAPSYHYNSAGYRLRVDRCATGRSHIQDASSSSGF